jgi:hypothetical protein
MTPEVAALLMVGFVPLLLAVLAFRDWQRSRDMHWPPPASVIVSWGAVALLLALLSWAIVVP